MVIRDVHVLRKQVPSRRCGSNAFSNRSGSRRSNLTRVDSYDVIVIGGGMAGVSIGYELAADRRVLVLDMESTLAYHTTGRSAAMFLESYGGPVIRALTTASRAFLESAPGDPLLAPLPMLHIGRPGHGAAVAQLHREVSSLVPDVELLDPQEAAGLQPWLRAESVELAVLEPGAMEIDVHGLHQLYVHGLRSRGGIVAVGARISSARRRGTAWVVRDAAGTEWQGSVVVDAAGAWADEVAGTFGVAGVGLRALRRSAFMVDGPSSAGGPMVADIDDTFYVKPDRGRMLCSPSDETPQQPGDARPDTTEIARAIQVINEATTLNVRHVRSAWAGLRSFVADRSPVVGYDHTADGFFWFAAQGGYGIQTAPALARTGAALLRGEQLPHDVAARGLTPAAVAPDRAQLR
ncbi:MAG: D-arginine dehydrogenase [Pseudonocardiales bacterium]|nr:D-arginine dehydrogenase [Pseudonocardiales bacterium]